MLGAVYTAAHDCLVMRVLHGLLLLLLLLL
jgi:hypothetical protein